MNRLTKNEVSASTLRAWRADAANLIESGVATSMISVCPVALSALCHEVLERRIVEPECSQCLGSRKVIVIRHGDEISIPCPKCSTVKGSEPAGPGCPCHGRDIPGCKENCPGQQALKSSVPWKCDWPGCTLKGWHGHAGLPPDYK